MRTHLILIRHGETDWNMEGRYQGQSDTPLNREGLEQARRLAETLRHEKLDVVYTSPLQRAMETALIVADRSEVPVHIDDRLMEINLGNWEGLLVDEIVSANPDIFHLWETSPWTVSPPGGESLSQLMERVSSAASEIGSRHDGCHIGIVAHKLSLVMLKIRYQGIDPSLVRKIHLPNTHWEKIAINTPRF